MLRDMDVSLGLFTPASQSCAAVRLDSSVLAAHRSVLSGRCLSVAGGILQPRRTEVRIRQLVATGEPVQAVMEGFKFADHATYVARGRTWSVPLESAWGNGPGYSRGESVTIYVSETDPQFVATRDGYVTSSVQTLAPFPLIGAGMLVILLAGPGLATRIARARLNQLVG